MGNLLLSYDNIFLHLLPTIVYHMLRMVPLVNKIFILYDHVCIDIYACMYNVHCEE